MRFSLYSLLLCLLAVPVAAEPIKVVATTGMIATSAQKIGGKHVKVTSLMGPGVDPHLYQASEAAIRAMSEADVILYNGLNLEGKMGEVFEKMGKSAIVVAVTDGIEREDLISVGEGEYDPHVWFSLSLWEDASGAIRDAFIKKKPDLQDTFENNTLNYIGELKQLHFFIKQTIASIPKEQRVLVTAHDAFSYFGKEYGFEVKPIQGISTEDEASVKEINALVDMLTERKIKAVFVESSVPRKNVEALVEGAKAKGHDLVIGGELYSDALGDAGGQAGNYIGMVRFNVLTIAKALGS